MYGLYGYNVWANVSMIALGCIIVALILPLLYFLY